MKLIAVPIDDEALREWAPHWMPFLPMIAKRSKEPLLTLINRVMSKEMRLGLIWDEATNQAKALIGIRLHYRGDDLIAELLWTAGHGRTQWQHLLPELENMLARRGRERMSPAMPARLVTITQAARLPAHACANGKGALMGSSSPQQVPVTQQTQQNRDPWAPAQPYLQNAMSAASGMFNAQQGYQPYTGATIAPLNPTLQKGIDTLSGMYTSELGGTAGVNAARTAGTDLLGNQGLSPELKSLYEQAKGDQNPYLQNILNTSNRQIGDRINSSMSGAGRYGSGQHADVMARALAESADPVLAQDYARRQQQMQGILEGGQQRMGQWAQLMPTLDEARYAPAKGLAGLGQFQQERDQTALNNQIKLYQDQQAYQWEQLGRLNAIVGGAGALGGSTTGTNITNTPINQPSTLQRLFGGAAAGAGIGGSFGGPAGAGIGALGGGLLGMM